MESDCVIAEKCDNYDSNGENQFPPREPIFDRREWVNWALSARRHAQMSSQKSSNVILMSKKSRKKLATKQNVIYTIIFI